MLCAETHGCCSSSFLFSAPVLELRPSWHVEPGLCQMQDTEIRASGPAAPSATLAARYFQPSVPLSGKGEKAAETAAAAAAGERRQPLQTLLLPIVTDVQVSATCCGRGCHWHLYCCSAAPNMQQLVQMMHCMMQVQREGYIGSIPTAAW